MSAILCIYMYTLKKREIKPFFRIILNIYTYCILSMYRHLFDMYVHYGCASCMRYA